MNNDFFLEKTVVDIINEISKRQIICFGFGECFKDFARMMRHYSLDEKIKCVVDNDPYYQGKKYELLGRSINILNPSLLSDIDEETSIVVTVYNRENFFDIEEQILRIRNKQLTVYWNGAIPYYHWLCQRMRYVDLPETLHYCKKQLIPKQIHYCWFGDKQIPPENLKWMESWRKYCSDYEIICWNETNYDVCKHPYMKAAYNAGKYAFVSDYARLDIVYNYGGIYLDTDVEVMKNLDDLLYQRGFAGFQQNELLATGLGFGAIRNLPIIKEFLSQYDNVEFKNFNTNKERTFIKLCSDIQTDYLIKKGYKYNNSVVNVDGLNIYPAPVLCGLIDGKMVESEIVFLTHHFQGLWG